MKNKCHNTKKWMANKEDRMKGRKEEWRERREEIKKEDKIKEKKMAKKKKR